MISVQLREEPRTNGIHTHLMIDSFSDIINNREHFQNTRELATRLQQNTQEHKKSKENDGTRRKEFHYSLGGVYEHITVHNPNKKTEWREFVFKEKY